MDVKDNHGTLQVHVPPARGIGALATAALVLALACLLAMLGAAVRTEHIAMPLSVLPLLGAGAGLCALAGVALRRLTRVETLQIGLFVRTGREQDTVNVRTSDLLAVGKDEAPSRASRAGWLAAFGLGPGRLRLHTSRGDFLFGAALTDDDITRLVWRLTPICRENLRPRGPAHNHRHH